MKKLIISIFILIFTSSFCNCCIAANNTQNAEISKIENELYGCDYINEQLLKRVERLEKTIYGSISSGDLQSRIKRLANDINSDLIGLEIPPAEDTFIEEDEVADSSVQYPVVDAIEQKIFGQTYKNRDFHTRIVTIERKLFNKIYDVDDYKIRMDRIKAEIMPEVLAFDNNRFNYDENALNSADLSGIKNNIFSGRMPYGQSNYTRPYSNYGDSNFPQRNIEEELAELEYDAFGTEFSNESIKSRIKRLKSASKAKRSASKYDSQKFQQKMSTAMEIGAMILMILAMVL